MYLAPARSQIDVLVRQRESGAVAPDDDTRLKDLLLGTLAATPQVTGIAFVRDDLHAVWAGLDGGQYRASSGSWVDRAEVRLALREAPTLAGFTWGEPLFIETSGETFLAPRRPVRIGNELKGVEIGR